jgi:hypothetical protein
MARQHQAGPAKDATGTTTSSTLATTTKGSISTQYIKNLKDDVS